MGNIYTKQVSKKISFEMIQRISREKQNAQLLLISTLDEHNQRCLIKGTLKLSEEESKINDIIKRNEQRLWSIVLYGTNCVDEKPISKIKEFQELGFVNIYHYCGGLFEWLLLQDIYGDDQFETTQKEIDILRYKPNLEENILLPMLKYG